MSNRPFVTTLAIVGLVAAGCRENTKEQSPGEVLARDSSLASDIRQADTSAFAEAADVAMAFNPDSALPPVNSRAPSASARAASPPVARVPVARVPAARVPAARVPAARVPAARVPAARVPASSTSPVPMVVDRPRIRPMPATIHPEPIPTRTLPAAPARGASATNHVDPSAAEILATVPGAELEPTASGDPCASPATADQRRCLMLHLARSDVVLDRTYQALIVDMKREAGATPGGKEPESVQQLRAAQRAWLVYRDSECRRRNRDKEGQLWAPVRAQCLGEFSGNREAELARALRERR